MNTFGGVTTRSRDGVAALEWVECRPAMNWKLECNARVSVQFPYLPAPPQERVFWWARTIQDLGHSDIDLDLALN